MVFDEKMPQNYLIHAIENNVAYYITAVHDRKVGCHTVKYTTASLYSDGLNFLFLLAWNKSPYLTDKFILSLCNTCMCVCNMCVHRNGKKLVNTEMKTEYM